MHSILIVCASPIDQDRLRLNAEVKNIRHALERSKNREQWTIVSNEAVTVDDLRRSLLDLKPTILHFSGHGDANGICFEDDSGESNSTCAESLVKLLHHFKENLKCVILNSCYSEAQARIIREEIDYIIGMNSAIEDASARRFAVAYYDAIFAGTDFRTAFDLACTCLDLNKLDNSDVPIFIAGNHLDEVTIAYEAIIPEIERVLYAYMNTPFENRWKFTSTGESLKPKLKEFYGEKLLKTVNKVQVKAIQRINGRYLKVETNLRISRTNQFYICSSNNKNVKIDWESTVGLWSLPVKVFLTLGSKVPVVARVIAQLDDFYIGDFSDRGNYQSINLRSNCGEMLNSYLLIDSSAYRDVLRILADGNQHTITVELVQTSRELTSPIISKLLSENWIYEIETSE
jgi:hypothetical protein